MCVCVSVFVRVCVMKQGRGSADATSPRAINQTGPAAESVQIGLISLGIKQESRYKDVESVGDRERKKKDGGWKKLKSTLFYFYTPM